MTPERVRWNPSLKPRAFLDRVAASAPAAGFRTEAYGRVGDCPLLGLTKPSAGPGPRVYLSAGIHGDEPAPPLALGEMLEAGVFGGSATWRLCPMLNPAGFLLRTRESAEGLDLNRDYRNTRSAEILAHIAWLERQPPFDLAICLHEDWEAKGFYLYELNPQGRPSLAEAMIAAVAADFPIDPSASIDGRPARGGILRPDTDPLERELWAEAVYLLRHGAGPIYTIETPSSFPLERRVAALRAAVEAALGPLKAPGSRPRSEA